MNKTIAAMASMGILGVVAIVGPSLIESTSNSGCLATKVALETQHDKNDVATEVLYLSEKQYANTKLSLLNEYTSAHSTFTLQYIS